MTVPLHAELQALCALFYEGSISEEEWALLQIHMAYCEECNRLFIQYGRQSITTGSREVTGAADGSHYD